MKYSKSCVQFGGGVMGRIWVNALSEYFESVALVDPDSSSASAVEGTHAHYLNLDILNNDEINNQSNSFLREYLGDSTVWSMAIRPELHEHLIELAINERIHGLLVEKPVANDLDNLERLATQTEERDIITGVDYIEMIHPVYEGILEKAVKDGFSPGRGFHWRSKDLRYQVDEGNRYEGGVPYIKDDLCHDISEIYGLFRALDDSDDDDDDDDSPLKISDVFVDEFDLWADAEYRGEYQFRDFHNDIAAQVRLRCDSGAEFTLRGGYDDTHERRFFFWVDESEKFAYYGNTLHRDFTTPAAYKIVGKEDVKEVEEKLKSGDVVEKSAEKDLMDGVGARPISFCQVAYQERVTRMCRRVFSNDAPATLRDALHIERIVEDIYEEAGNPDASYY